MSLALNIMELVSAKARAAGAEKVSEVEIEIGTLAGVMAEALTFCFAAAARNTPAEGARLAVREIAGQAKCLACSHCFPVDSLLAQCPHCWAYATEITQGRELRVVSLIVDE
ncbi:hydrogenase maturation nickel metallochaperone HypA/HybF [Thiovibrio sp. JS02]